MRPQRPSHKIENYMAMLKATGMPDREVARAGLYAERYGLAALSGEGCTVFAEPTCETGWNCLEPGHQQFE
jgi:hypothetical protein